MQNVAQNKASQVIQYFQEKIPVINCIAKGNKRIDKYTVIKEIKETLINHFISTFILSNVIASN